MQNDNESFLDFFFNSSSPETFDVRNYSSETLTKVFKLKEPKAWTITKETVKIIVAAIVVLIMGIVIFLLALPPVTQNTTVTKPTEIVYETPEPVKEEVKEKHEFVPPVIDTDIGLDMPDLGEFEIPNIPTYTPTTNKYPLSSYLMADIINGLFKAFTITVGIIDILPIDECINYVKDLIENPDSEKAEELKADLRNGLNVMVDLNPLIPNFIKEEMHEKIDSLTFSAEDLKCLCENLENLKKTAVA